MNDSAGSVKQSAGQSQQYFWLFAILVAAAWLRFRGLDFQSFWYDELYSAWISAPDNSFGTVVKLTLDDVHPPFYQLMMWLSYKVFGYNEWAGRLPSAVAGTATVAVIFLLGRELFGKRAGLYAAALAISNYYLLYYSQEARSYAFLYLLCTLSFWYFVRALRSESVINVFAYAIATLLLLYTHYFGFVLLAAQGIVLVIYMAFAGGDRPLLMRALLAAILVGFGVAPVIPSLLGHASIDSFWITQPGPGFFIGYFVAYFSAQWLAIAFAALIAVSLAGFVAAKDSWARLGILMLLIWVVVGYLLPWMRGFIGQPVITDRNTIMVLPALLLLAGYGLSLLPGVWLQRLLGIGLVAYSYWYLVTDLEYYERIKKNQYREITAAMDAFEPTLPIYTLKVNHSKYNVYFTQLGSDLFAKDSSEVEPLLAAGDAPPLFWLADGHTRVLQTDIEERYGLVDTGRFKFKATIAELLVNPAAAEQLAVEPMAGRPGGYSTTELLRLDEPLRILVAIAPEDREEFAGTISIELISPFGEVLSAAVKASGPVPAIFSLDTLPENSSISVTLTGSEREPDIWLIPQP